MRRVGFAKLTNGSHFDQEEQNEKNDDRDDRQIDEEENEPQPGRTIALGSRSSAKLLVRIFDRREFDLNESKTDRRAEQIVTS